MAVLHVQKTRTRHSFRRELGGFGLRKNGGKGGFEIMGQAGVLSVLYPNGAKMAGQLAGTNFGPCTGLPFMDKTK